jgi:hypothetical protein
MIDPIAERVVTCHLCLDRSDHPIVAGWLFLATGRWVCSRCQRDGTGSGRDTGQGPCQPPPSNSCGDGQHLEDTGESFGAKFRRGMLQGEPCVTHRSQSVVVTGHVTECYRLRPGASPPLGGMGDRMPPVSGGSPHQRGVLAAPMGNSWGPIRPVAISVGSGSLPRNQTGRRPEEG